MIRSKLVVAVSFLAMAAACRAPALPHTVAFRVVDQAGAPLADARGQLREATHEGAEPASAFDELSAWRSPWCSGDANGRVHVALPTSRGERRLVEVRARGFAPRWVWLAEPALELPVQRGVLELADVALATGGRIRGFVHTDGVAARGMWTVRARGAVLRDGESVFHTGGVCDAVEFGSFELVDVGAGEVELEVVSPNGRYVAGPFVTVTPGATETASIRLPAGFDPRARPPVTRASVGMRVTGNPPRDLELRLRDEHGTCTGSILMHAAGTFGPLGAEPGRYTYVLASRSGGWSVTQPRTLVLAAGAVVQLEFDCARSHAALDIVSADDGAPIALERFAIHPAGLEFVDRDPTSFHTDDGGHAIVELPAGAYELASVPIWEGEEEVILARFEWPPAENPLRLVVRAR